jgi:hypothetical protein
MSALTVLAVIEQLAKRLESRHHIRAVSDLVGATGQGSRRGAHLIGAMSRPCLSASDRSQRIGLALPQGDPSVITAAERYRVASLID